MDLLPAERVSQLNTYRRAETQLLGYLFVNPIFACVSPLPLYYLIMSFISAKIFYFYTAKCLVLFL